MHKIRMLGIRQFVAATKKQNLIVSTYQYAVCFFISKIYFGL